jgi:hypothetical protein
MVQQKDVPPSMRSVAATSRASLALKMDVLRHPKIHCYHTLLAGCGFNSFASGRVKTAGYQKARPKLPF